MDQLLQYISSKGPVIAPMTSRLPIKDGRHWKNRYQILTRVKNRYQILISVKISIK